MYDIQFSNKYVKNDRVVAKARRFRDLTGRLVDWLGTEFVDWRGTDCFDNPQEHLRAFGNRYRDKAEKPTKRR